MKTIINILLLLCSIQLAAQYTTKVKYVNITGNTHAFIEQLPTNYGTSNKKYPLLLCLHGVGSLGKGNVAAMNKFTGGGLPTSLVKSGRFPKNFIVGKDTFQFVLITPQWVVWPSPQDIDAAINYAIKNYKVDTNRVYITGLSMGGGATWDYVGVVNGAAKKVTAIVPISGASNVSAAKANYVRGANLPVWALHNDGDPTVSVLRTTAWIAAINISPQPKVPARQTIFHNWLHDAWTKAYDPNYRENGKNVYEWMLSYTTKKAPDTIVVKLPADTIKVTPKKDTVKHNKYILAMTDVNARECYYPNGITGKTILPHDTIEIPGGTYSLISLGNLHGREKDSIVITWDHKTPAVIEQFRLATSNEMSYFKLSGESKDTIYGLKIKTIAANYAIHCRIDHVEMSGGDNGVFYHINPFTNNTNSYYPNYTVTGVKIDNNYVHDTRNEGMYVGHTYPNADPYSNNLVPIRMKAVEICFNRVENTGWDGIQLSNATDSCSIHDNIVSNYGLANADAQQAGIISGANTNCKIYRNTITSGTGNAIQVFGYGLNEVYNNIIGAAGNNGTAGGLETFFAASRPIVQESRPHLSISFHDNKIYNPLIGRGIATVNAEQQTIDRVDFINNQICAQGLPSDWQTRFFNGGGAILVNKSNNYSSCQ